MLHITNGDSASDALKKAGIQGAMLAWADVLHEGPIPAGLSLTEMSQIRAGFIQSRGWATAMEAQLHFQTRDAILLSAAKDGEVVLWNSPELFDQLHLLQILNWYAHEGRSFGLPSLVFVPQLLAVMDDSDAAFVGHFSARVVVSEAQIAEAAHLWQLITAANPRALAQWVEQGNSHFPYMVAGLKRWLEEYPDAQGLSLTQRYILEVLLTKDTVTPDILFGEVSAKEAMPFMGDASFWHALEPLVALSNGAVLCNGEPQFTPPGLFEFDDAFYSRELTLTALGKALLAGAGDLLAQGMQERWMGGVCLQGTHSWRINRDTGELFRG